MDWTMFAPYIGTVARALIAAVGGYAVAKGWTDPASWDTWAGAIVVAVTGAWGMYTHAQHDVRVTK